MPSNLSNIEKISLWKQRFHEAQGGAEDFIANVYGEEGLRSWISAVAAIEGRFIQGTEFAEEEMSRFWRTRFLNAVDASTEYLYQNFGNDAVRGWMDKFAETASDHNDANNLSNHETPEIWKKRYFRSQAAAEEFILGSYGEKALGDWIDANSSIAASNIATNYGRDSNKMLGFMHRLLDQLQLYDSKIELQQIGSAFALVNRECGILRFRREAEAKGVKLTFESPCHYCIALNEAIAEKYTGENVKCERTDIGCEWNNKYE